jgi:DNA polymerase-3 subunit alpha
MTEEDIKKLQRSGIAEDDNGRYIQKYGALIKGFPNIMSLHPCGILISENPITDYATLFMPPKGFATAQIDMFTAEDIGLNKFDILSQRGLSHIRTCLELVKKNHNIDIDITDKKKFREDPQVRKQIREANTIGCFYIESPAMRQLLKKLGCDDYLTLVAASSIIRPGVAESGMMRMYLYYYHNRDKIVYLHPVFEEHLSETFGVMVFQESVMIIAHSYAGLSLTDTDVLRRAMSGKYRTNNEFRMIRDKFFQGADKLGRPAEVTLEVWRQMESFYGYSFNKAHSASFAVESYMSLYLKTHYPMEFMVAVINNFGGFYSTELYFMELLKTGCRIHPPCVNHSDQYTNIKDGEAFTGLVHVKGLQQKLVETILEDRRVRGPFGGLYQFIERVNPGLEQLNKLISAGSFGFTGHSKKKLLWDGDLLQKKNQAALNRTAALFEEPPAALDLPDMQDERLDDLHDQIELLNFTLSNPFEIVNDDAGKYVRACELTKHLGRTVTMLAYFIARKHVVTKTNKEMFFGTFLDPELNWIDTVHFPESAKRYPLHTAGFYRITGKVVADFGVYSLEARTMAEVGYKHSSYANLG